MLTRFIALAALGSTGGWGFDVSSMDRSVRPGDDFFLYANGSWLAHTPIPADKASIGPMDTVESLTRDQIRSIILASGGSGTGKIGALYRAYMNEAAVERLGARPLRQILAQIVAIKNKRQLIAFMGRSHQAPGASVFRLSVSPDERDPTRYALALSQSGLSLPRAYYLEPQLAAKKKAYRKYVETSLTLAKWPDAKGLAQRIVNFETRIAAVSWSMAQSQQLEKLYHPTAVGDLPHLAPSFEWQPWLAAAGVRRVRRIILRQNTALPNIAAVLASTDLDTLKAWEAFRVTDQLAPYLSRAFVAARFQFRNHDLYGQTAPPPRWERGVDLVDEEVGDLLGKAYVARYFPPSSKLAMEILVGHVRKALRHRIESVDWMSAETKRQALQKLSTMGQKLGYPEKWRDYRRLLVRPSDLVGNVTRSLAFEWRYQRRKIGASVNAREWDVTPQTVNGFYDEKRNQIVMPAAILQPPFFDAKADMAVNFGAIGAVIGHEMTHGFDSQGRKTDAHGRLRDWWRPADAAEFTRRADLLGAQYDAFTVAPSVSVDGGRTMSENIADLGGILLALDGYADYLQGREAPTVGGFTGRQRVFLGWAQILRSKFRPDALIAQVNGDPHSPDRFRVIGPLRNVDAWYDAWQVAPKDRYFLPPERRVRIW